VDKDLERPRPYCVRPKTSKKNPTTMRFTNADRNILNQLLAMTRLPSAVDVIRLAIRESLLHRKRKADALAYEERRDATKAGLKHLRDKRFGGKPEKDPIDDVFLPPPIVLPPPPPPVKEGPVKTLATCMAVLPGPAERLCSKTAGSWMYEGEPLCDPHANAYREAGYELRPFL
jgi:hypothetical protein